MKKWSLFATGILVSFAMGFGFVMVTAPTAHAVVCERYFVIPYCYNTGAPCDTETVSGGELWVCYEGIYWSGRLCSRYEECRPTSGDPVTKGKRPFVDP